MQVLLSLTPEQVEPPLPTPQPIVHPKLHVESEQVQAQVPAQSPEHATLQLEPHELEEIKRIREVYSSLIYKLYLVSMLQIKSA